MEVAAAPNWLRVCAVLWRVEGVSSADETGRSGIVSEATRSALLTMVSAQQQGRGESGIYSSLHGESDQMGF
jgi:hypothetical protein